MDSALAIRLTIVARILPHLLCSTNSRDDSTSAKIMQPCISDAHGVSLDRYICERTTVFDIRDMNGTLY